MLLIGFGFEYDVYFINHSYEEMFRALSSADFIEKCLGALDAIYILDHGLRRYFSHYKMESEKAKLKICSWNVSVIHSPFTRKRKLSFLKKELFKKQTCLQMNIPI